MEVTVSEVVERMLAVPAVTPSYVYFLQSNGDGGPVKIGVTTDPLKRLAALRSANAYEVNLLSLYRGRVEEEQYLHRVFADQCAHHEWFFPDDKLLEVASHGTVDLGMFADGSRLLELRIRRGPGGFEVFDKVTGQAVTVFEGLDAAQKFVNTCRGKSPKFVEGVLFELDCVRTML